MTQEVITSTAYTGAILNPGCHCHSAATQIPPVVIPPAERGQRFVSHQPESN